MIKILDFLDKDLDSITFYWIYRNVNFNNFIQKMSKMMYLPSLSQIVLYFDIYTLTQSEMKYYEYRNKFKSFIAS